MKTNYHIHDEIYKSRKREGRTGWADPDQVKEYHDILGKMLRHDAFPKSGRILEIGCGSGENVIWLAGKGFDVYGIDISSTAIEWTREKCRDQGIGIDLTVGDVMKLPDYYDSDFFDAVIDGHCLHCIIGSDRAVALEGIRHVLKAGGVLHLCSMCGEIEDEELLKDYDPRTRCIMREGTAFRYIGEPESIIRELEQSGFEVLYREILPKKVSHECDDLIALARKRD